MNSIIELKNQIAAANKAYREGNPFMSDIAFDELCESLQKQIPANDYKAFRETLFEKSGKVVHPWKMGSLQKFKAEEPAGVIQWINNHVENALNVSAKVDGISCRLHYSNGNLVSGTSRGDGTKGEDITDKVLKVNHVPKTISLPGEVDIRGELVILESDFAEIEGFANPRNTTAGIVGRKEATKDLEKITFVAYTIFGDKYTKKEQFEILEKKGFYTAWHKSITIAELQVKTAVTRDNLIDELKSYVKQKLAYDTDGIVMSDDGYRNEDVLIPEAQIAFKVNDEISETTVIDVQWGVPSKNGRMSPVLIVEPVTIDGTTVSRVTGNNLDYLEKMDIRFGSKVQIIKSGQIIPKIVSVIDNPSNSVKIVPPEFCPVCGAKLVVDGVDLRCINPECEAKQISEVTSFIKKFEVKHSAKKQLDNFGIKTIDDLISFLPNQSYKSEVTLYNEIGEKIFTASPQKIFCAMNFKGLAETQLQKIIEHYHFDWICGMKHVESEKNYMLSNLPPGIGPKLLDAFWDKVEDAIANTRKIMLDSRYSYDTSAQSEPVVKNASGESKGSICFTGALETMTRSEAQFLATASGFEVKGGVTKGLTYLVMADPNSNSSKARKARELGTKCISEKEFLAMCKNEEQNLEEL